MSILDTILIEVTEYLNYIFEQYHNRSLWLWVLFFFPFVIFLELPRYFIPVVMYPVLRLFGFPRDDLDEKKRFMETHPSVSVIIAGRNEQDVIGHTLSSLMEVDYDELEVLVLDDASEDNTYEIAKGFAERHENVKVFRNDSSTGRGGKPFGINMAYRMSSGDYIFLADADTTFDRELILHSIGPFYDEEVGVVTGNIKVRNRGANSLVDLQACEYLMGIGFWKTWTDMYDSTLHASGAFSVFRREVLEDVWGWDPDLSEDADISAKAHKLGWTIRFDAKAIAMTSVPTTFWGLWNQRIRWDRAFLRTYIRKHGDVLKFWRFNMKTAFELGMEYILQVAMTLLFPVYIILMLIYLPGLLLFVMGATYIFYCVQSAASLALAISVSERSSKEWILMQYVCLFPLYQMMMRMVRTYAIIIELFRLDYRDPFLPDTAYDNKEQW